MTPFTSSWNITPVQAQDATEILELMGRVITTDVTPDPELQADMLKNVSLNLEWSLAYPQRCCHLKYADSRGVLGVILVKDFWNLCSLFVVPEYHRQGIGRALFETTVAKCRGQSDKNVIWLNAAPRAIPFYQAMGCIPRQSDYPHPGGIQPMQLRLD